MSTRYVLDPTGSTNNLEARRGNDVTAYLYGTSLLGEQSPAGERLYYGRDGLGSVRFLANAAGAVTHRIDYGPFGEPRGEPAASLFQYAGEHWTPGVGLYYLRARHYDPVLGRFLTRDTVPGTLQAPQTLNLYSYAGNNPVNLTDPTGHFAPLAVGLLNAGLEGALYYLSHRNENVLQDRGFWGAVGVGFASGFTGAAAANWIGAAVPWLAQGILGRIVPRAVEGAVWQMTGNLLTAKPIGSNVVRAASLDVAILGFAPGILRAALSPSTTVIQYGGRVVMANPSWVSRVLLGSTPKLKPR